jgi:hypothetical protein
MLPALLEKSGNEFIDILRSRREEVKSRKRIKGAWGIPRLSEAMKDVISCEKLWGAAHMH